MSRQPRYWFPAKRYGWGWGLPTTWQGWVVLLIFFALILACAFFVLPVWGLLAFVACTAFLVALLVAVCWLTGEPPRWRRGDRE